MKIMTKIGNSFLFWKLQNFFGSRDSPLRTNMHLLVLKTSVFLVCT